MNLENSFASVASQQQSYRHQKPQRNDLRKFNSKEFLAWEQEYVEGDGSNTHYVLFLGVPGSGKTSILGSFIHCLYTQSTLYCRYRDEVTTPQDDKLFYACIEYFSDSGAVSSFATDSLNQLYKLSFEFKTDKQETKILNLVDCTRDIYQRFYEISNQQKTPFTPERHVDGSLKYQLPTLRKSIFPDYITALLESRAHVHVYLVCDGDEKAKHEFKQDFMLSIIAQELTEFAQHTGRKPRISLISSKVDLQYPNPFATDSQAAPARRNLEDFIPQTLKYLPDNTKCFYSGYLNNEHKQHFVVQKFNPTTLQLVDDLFVSMTGRKLPHTKNLAQDKSL